MGMGGHTNVAGALAASGANATATGVGYKTIYNQNRGGNEMAHMKPPSNAAPTNNNRSPRVGRVRGVSPGGSREKPTPGGKSSSSQVTAQSSSFAGRQQQPERTRRPNSLGWLCLILHAAEHESELI